MMKQLMKKHNPPKKGDKDRSQRSMLSYITVKGKNNTHVNTGDHVPLLDFDVPHIPASTDADAITSNNIVIESKVSTPTTNRQELCDSTNNEPVTRLGKLSDESLVNNTPQRKRSYFRILDSSDRKRLRLSSDSGSPSSQLRRRIKLSHSPARNVDRNSHSESCNLPLISPEKENDSELVSVPSKCSPPAARNILQEVVHRKDNSLTKKLSTDDFVDIENLGDFLNEDWGKEFIEREKLDLSEWKTCLVTNVKETNDGIMVELEEYGRKISNPASTSCFIQGYWGDEKLQCRDIVNIKGYFDNALKAWRVDHTRGYLVKHPDILMSGTCLVSSLFCQRRAVLSYLYPGLDSKNFSMLLGSLIHELLQEVLTRKLYSENEIKSLAVQLINKPRSVFQSYEFGLASVDLEKELLSIVPEIVNFINIYILEKVEDKMWPGKIVDILSTEENFWIPQLGFKGKADFILRAENGDRTQVSAVVATRIIVRRINDSTALLQLMPLELKTGRASNAIEHRAQIILYLMMMSEVRMSSDSGLLLYLKHNVLREITPHIAEKQGLVTTRNNLVDYYTANDSSSLLDDKLSSTPSLPEPINHHSGCVKCPYLTICSAHLKNETQLEDSNPLKTLSASALAHLTADHIQYVFRWTSLLKLEEIEKKKDMVAKISDIWRMSYEDREERGYCIGKLTIANVEKHGNKFVHRMLRSQNAPSFEMTKSGLTEGDYIVVSTDSRIAVAAGYVHSISTNLIDLKFDRMLDSTNNMLYVVDRYSVSETLLAFNTSSLFALLKNEDVAARMRRLIIDMKLPLFSSMKNVNPTLERSVLDGLNRYQRTAILKTLAAQDYLLIKGLPGTGKTATIVGLIRLLVQLKHTVLVTSHTHSAVDNILLRLRQHVDFLRLGPSARVHKELQSYCEDFKVENENIHTVEQLELLYNQHSVIAVTCMGCSHSLLNKRTFDYCIVDEATQVLQPSILKSLSSARKFVLVGDPNQLPPVVQSRKASNLGFNESLFVKLDRAEVTSTLSLQYRMNSQIMNLANSFAYNGLLQCDNENVRSATIQIRHNPKSVVNWLDHVVSPRIEDSILFLNTSRLSSSQTSPYINQTEADTTFAIIESLSRDVEDIGVIAPYREQVKLLGQMAIARQCDYIEINTVDQFQGRDKDVIIYSCTKNSNEKEGGILADKRRLTVAITRARRKLIIIGNVSVLEKYAVFEELIGLIPKKNLIDVLSV